MGAACLDTAKLEQRGDQEHFTLNMGHQNWSQVDDDAVAMSHASMLQRLLRRQRKLRNPATKLSGTSTKVQSVDSDIFDALMESAKPDSVHRPTELPVENSGTKKSVQLFHA